MKNLKVGMECTFTNKGSWYDRYNGYHCVITKIVDEDTVIIDFLTEETWCYHKLVAMMVTPEELKVC